MSIKKRKFSVPYNNSNPHDWLKRVYEPYKDYIENVFLSIPGLIQSHQGQEIRYLEICNAQTDVEKQYVSNQVKKIITSSDINAKVFLKLTKGLFKRIVTLNSGVYLLDQKEMSVFVDKCVSYLVTEYEVDGFICTDFMMAKVIHEKWPNLEIHTSCNCYQWNLKQMEIWKREAGVTVFNPPREILRTPGKLKEMHDAGYTLKCIVNEGCLYGCPNTVNHAMKLACGKGNYKWNCFREDLANYFKGNYVLPRWLRRLDKYVDIYKLSGRLENTDYIVRALDAYINERDDVPLSKIIIGGVAHIDIGFKREILAREVHDNLLTCEGKNCEHCHKCNDFILKMYRDGYIKAEFIKYIKGIV